MPIHIAVSFFLKLFRVILFIGITNFYRTLYNHMSNVMGSNKFSLYFVGRKCQLIQVRYLDNWMQSYFFIYKWIDMLFSQTDKNIIIDNMSIAITSYTIFHFILLFPVRLTMLIAKTFLKLYEKYFYALRYITFSSSNIVFVLTFLKIIV